MQVIAEAVMMEKLDAFLMVSESMHNANMYYATKFAAPDAFIFIQTKKKEILLVSQMEYERGRKESSIRDVRSILDYGMREKLNEYRDADRALTWVLKKFFEEEKIVKIGVPRDFPTFLSDELRSLGFSIECMDKLIEKSREVKTAEEIAYIERAQLACEEAMKRAKEVIKSCKEKKGLLFNGSEVLTSEKIRSIIELRLAELGCSAEETIVASGRQSSDPHCAGTGYIQSSAPVVIDIFPRLKREKYYADMTRTFLAAMPSSEFEEMRSSVLKAQNIALKMIKPGLTGKAIHDAVCDSFAEDGYKTLREGKISSGFLHGTGHGVGLAVHEGPGLNETGEALREGNVITVEPGLYDPDIGGVRIEDLVVVTGKGHRNLTRFPKDW